MNWKSEGEAIETFQGITWFQDGTGHGVYK